MDKKSIKVGQGCLGLKCSKIFVLFRRKIQKLTAVFIKVGVNIKVAKTTIKYRYRVYDNLKPRKVYLKNQIQKSRQST